MSEARYLEGSGGYTGSIAEKGSYRLVQRRPVARAVAEEMTDELLDDERFRDKWGPAGAIPVGSEHGRFETVTVTVTPKPGTYRTQRDPLEQMRRQGTQAAKDKVRPRAGEHVVGIGGIRQVDAKVGYKALTGSKRVTRYYVRGLLCDQPFDSQAEARGWAMRQLEAMADQGRPRMGGPVSIQAITEREDGSDLVRIVPQVKSVKFEVDVAVSRLVDTAVTGWVFFGRASS